MLIGEQVTSSSETNDILPTLNGLFGDHAAFMMSGAGAGAKAEAEVGSVSVSAPLALLAASAWASAVRSAAASSRALLSDCRGSPVVEEVEGASSDVAGSGVAAPDACFSSA